jgi:3-oxoacyl-[acyl-carrier-protein] synthase II
VTGLGRSKTLQRALVNSFGFGGKNIVIAVSRVDVPALRDTILASESGSTYHERLVAPALAHSRQARLIQ